VAELKITAEHKLACCFIHRQGFRTLSTSSPWLRSRCFRSVVRNLKTTSPILSRSQEAERS